MKLLPRSMAGQLAALLLVGLLAAHVLAIAALRYNAEVLNPVARERGLERLAIAWRMIELADEADVSGVIATLSTPSGRFWLEPAAPTPRKALSEEEEIIFATLARHLPHLPDDAIWVSLHGENDSLLGTFDVELGWSVLIMESAVRLPDGQWLHARQIPLAGYQWWRLLRFSLPTSTLPVLLLASFFVWRMLRPIKALASAAEKVSRGERIEPLRVEGPRETREVSAAFNLMQEKLTRFVEDRTRMLAAISHDFRTPLTSLRIRVEMVEDAKLRDAMIKTLDEMRHMVDETLTFARDDSDSEATQPVDLHSLLRDIAAEQKARRDVEVEGQMVDGTVFVYRARPHSLRRAITNLVDNAVRHGRYARMRLAVAPDGGVRIEIDDGGPGIADAMLERVFEPFFQVNEARTHNVGGVGLGLSIARSCVRSHGGDLTLRNLGTGLRATIVLPAVQQH